MYLGFQALPTPQVICISPCEIVVLSNKSESLCWCPIIEVEIVKFGSSENDDVWTRWECCCIMDDYCKNGLPPTLIFVNSGRISDD